MVIQVPGRPNYKSIKLQTRNGNDIDNRQVSDFSQIELRLIPNYSQEFKGAIPRNRPNPIYNCHGMTFGNARTTIGPESLQMILNDDGYTEIQSENCLPGDVVIYYNDRGEITHSGIVVIKPSNDPFKIPWVVSKWGKYSEVYHQAYNVPPIYGPILKLTYWRITK